MAILNLTPDSFYSESRSASAEAAVSRTAALLQTGADIIDLGAQSTRPGAEVLGPDAEWERLAAPLTAIRAAHPTAVLSIDTFYGEVARKALAAGADIINDVTAGLHDPSIVTAAVRHNAPFIAMHNPAAVGAFHTGITPNPVVKSVYTWLHERVQFLLAAGVKDVVVDPGFGFGKTHDQNWQLLNGLAMLQGLGTPILVGLSRKSMIWKTLEGTAESALAGTLAAQTAAMLKGAGIVRVHDVQAAADTVRILERMRT